MTALSISRRNCSFVTTRAINKKKTKVGWRETKMKRAGGISTTEQLSNFSPKNFPVGFRLSNLISLRGTGKGEGRRGKWKSLESVCIICPWQTGRGEFGKTEIKFFFVLFFFFFLIFFSSNFEKKNKNSRFHLSKYGDNGVPLSVSTWGRPQRSHVQARRWWSRWFQSNDVS